MSRPRSDRLPTRRVLSHLAVMAAVSVVLGVIVAGLAIPFAGVAGIGARNAARTMDNLPEELETETLPQRTQILDRDGKVVATLYDQNRVEVPLRQISRTMVKAIVAIEDYRFYQHGALDLKGTLRAFLTNAANDGAAVQGGSSITQQLVKQTLVTQAKSEEERREATDDSYARKLRELRYAIALEETYSKDWILERYLNIVYFGDGAYGIQAAAKHYFNVNARELDLAQAATLAGLVKNPVNYDPTTYPDRAAERRNVVLDRMAELGAAPRAKVEKIKDRGLGLDPQRTDNGCVDSSAPFFCDYVLRYLMADPSLGETKQERRDLLLSGGLTIRTTVDADAQASADRAVRSAVYPKARAIGGLAMVEPGTGEVRAVAQSRPMGRNKAAGETFLNYVVNQKYGDSAGFQAGSTFKVFVLAAAIEQGIPLSQIIQSPEKMVISETTFEDCGGGPYGYGEWEVSNSTSSGPMNLYTGTRESVNTFFAQLEQLTGLCKPFRLAKAMGVELTNPMGKKPGLAERVPTFTLGVADASPLEMAEAFATFGARGLHCDARPVTAIEDSKRNVLKEYGATCEQVMQQSTADAVNDILRGVIEGGFAAAQALPQPAAGKTGTTQNGRSVWFVGYTPNLAAAAMIAGANQLGAPQTLKGVDIGPQTIYDASGSAYAAPIWGAAMRGVVDELPDVDFVYPSGVPGAGSEYVPPPPTFEDDDSDFVETEEAEPAEDTSGGTSTGGGGTGGNGGGGGNGNGGGRGNGGGGGNGGGNGR